MRSRPFGLSLSLSILFIALKRTRVSSLEALLKTKFGSTSFTVESFQNHGAIDGSRDAEELGRLYPILKFDRHVRAFCYDILSPPFATTRVSLEAKFFPKPSATWQGSVFSSDPSRRCVKRISLCRSGLRLSYRTSIYCCTSSQGQILAASRIEISLDD